MCGENKGTDRLCIFALIYILCKKKVKRRYFHDVAYLILLWPVSLEMGTTRYVPTLLANLLTLLYNIILNKILN